MNIVLIIILIVSIILNIILLYNNVKTKKEANTDGLTGLLNRRQFELDFYFSSFDRITDAKYLIIVDIDNFKRINDNLGHRTGDIILKNVAEDMTKLVRKTDKIYRIGGDEFAILTSSLKCISELKNINQLSIGSAVISNNNNKAKTFDLADTAMYKHKQGKK